MLVYLDGEYLPGSEAKVSIDDRGFVFGDGVYEVTRAVDGRLFAEREHWSRLERGMGELKISAAGRVSREIVREVSDRLLRENELTSGHATIYLQVTRGTAPRTHWFPPEDTPPTVYLSASPFEIPAEMRENGASAIILPDIRWARCDIKTINLLGAVMAKQKAREAGAYDAILVRDGAVTEGGATNVFGVVDGELRTSPNSNYILPGITRDIILELAEEAGIPLRQTPMLLDELHRADELFFTGTTTDVQAAVKLDGKTVGTGQPGPVSRKLHEGLMKMMRSGD